MRAASATLVLVSLLLASTAEAQLAAPPPLPGDRPTSGEMSVYSGRTLGVGEQTITGSIGWPGAFAQLDFALASTFDFGVRAGFLWGSPYLGSGLGLGAELAVPLRFHVWGEAPFDVAIVATPAVTIGEGALQGHDGASFYARNLGGGARLELGAVAGYQANDELTFFFGATLMVGAVWMPSNGALDAVGTLFAPLGLEYLLARDLGFSVRLEPGGGFANNVRFVDRFVLRGTLGFSYLF